jgi:hypothetical protein
LVVRGVLPEVVSTVLLEKIISTFIVISGTKHIFVGIDSTGIRMTSASQYYTDRTGLRRKYAKLSIGAMCYSKSYVV